MKLQQLRKYLTDDSLVLDQATHVYWRNSIQYDSVTTYLARFCQPVDTKALAEKVAEEEDRLPKDVCFAWASKATNAKTLGRLVHKQAELMWAKGDDYAADVICPPGYFDSLSTFWTNRRDLRRALTEVQICNSHLRLAGTIDLLALYKDDLTILDWKTGKEDPSAIGFQWMLPPLDNLMHAQYNLYALQTAIYARILLDSYALRVNRILVVWLDGKGGYKLHEVPPYDIHVENLVAHRRNELATITGDIYA